VRAVTEYRTPAAASETEFTEKRSRFIGHVWPVETEREAKTRIEETRKRYHDARHNCWCYLIREGGIVRWSDDGEPQGTAGQPMLSVFQKEGVTGAACVVTRYFGGVLLGSGGLSRAYGRSARDALAAAGTALIRPWSVVEALCPYALFEQLRQLIPAMGGLEGEHAFGASVTLRALLPEKEVEPFAARLREMSAGACDARVTGRVWKAV